MEVTGAVCVRMSKTEPSKQLGKLPGSWQPRWGRGESERTGTGADQPSATSLKGTSLFLVYLTHMPHNYRWKEEATLKLEELGFIYQDWGPTAVKTDLFVYPLKI